MGIRAVPCPCIIMAPLYLSKHFLPQSSLQISQLEQSKPLASTAIILLFNARVSKTALECGSLDSQEDHRSREPAALCGSPAYFTEYR